mmetsp:Transcript_27255/g.109154  ORF Transcript_27255/g.109154 Transcript_27255/m.109154 type:complete len:232 (+) Transcript_27255:1068-1763(+)
MTRIASSSRSRSSGRRSRISCRTRSACTTRGAAARAFLGVVVPPSSAAVDASPPPVATASMADTVYAPRASSTTTTRATPRQSGETIKVCRSPVAMCSSATWTALAPQPVTSTTASCLTSTTTSPGASHGYARAMGPCVAVYHELTAMVSGSGCRSTGGGASALLFPVASCVGASLSCPHAAVRTNGMLAHTAATTIAAVAARRHRRGTALVVGRASASGRRRRPSTTTLP